MAATGSAVTRCQRTWPRSHLCCGCGSRHYSAGAAAPFNASWQTACFSREVNVCRPSTGLGRRRLGQVATKFECRLVTNTGGVDFDRSTRSGASCPSAWPNNPSACRGVGLSFTLYPAEAGVRGGCTRNLVKARKVDQILCQRGHSRREPEAGHGLQDGRILRRVPTPPTILDAGSYRICRRRSSPCSFWCRVAGPLRLSRRYRLTEPDANHISRRCGWFLYSGDAAEPFNAPRQSPCFSREVKARRPGQLEHGRCQSRVICNLGPLV